MDKNFMEFWGNTLLSSAKNQQHMEEMAKWFTGSFINFQEMNNMFYKLLGIDLPSKDAPDYLSLWEKSTNEFMNSYRQFFSLIDLVPRKAVLDLEEENKKLKTRIAELEKKDTPIESIIQEEVTLAKEGIKGFQGLVEEQSRQFQKIMEGMGKAFSTDRQPTGEKGDTKEATKSAAAKKRPSRRRKTEK